jgi:hypothetical protein
VAVTAASCSQDAPPGPATKPLNLLPKISDFALYGVQGVSVGSYSHVGGGDIGVVAVAQATFGTQLVIADHVQVDSTHNLLAPSTTLGDGASVGDVQTDHLTNNGATLGQEGPFPLTMPSLPFVATGTAGPGVDVQAHTRVSLPPGNYGALTMDQHSYLILSPGKYSFTSINMDLFASRPRIRTSTRPPRNCSSWSPAPTRTACPR